MTLFRATLLTGLLGAAIMLVFDGVWARLIGMALLGAFMVCGMFLIASPRFLESDGDRPGGDGDGT